MENVTVTIKNETYNVLAVIPVDAIKYANTAKVIMATVYMQKGKKGHVYSTAISVKGTLNDWHVANCGAWSNEDIAKIKALSI